MTVTGLIQWGVPHNGNRLSSQAANVHHSRPIYLPNIQIKISSQTILKQYLSQYNATTWATKNIPSHFPRRAIPNSYQYLLMAPSYGLPSGGHSFPYSAMILVRYSETYGTSCKLRHSQHTLYTTVRNSYRNKKGN